MTKYVCCFILLITKKNENQMKNMGINEIVVSYSTQKRTKNFESEKAGWENVALNSNGNN